MCSCAAGKLDAGTTAHSCYPCTRTRHLPSINFTVANSPQQHIPDTDRSRPEKRWRRRPSKVRTPNDRRPTTAPTGLSCTHPIGTITIHNRQTYLLGSLMGLTFTATGCVGQKRETSGSLLLVVLLARSGWQNCEEEEGTGGSSRLRAHSCRSASNRRRAGARRGRRLARNTKTWPESSLTAAMDI